MNPERIILSGMMCSGKTTVGKALSRILGWNFVDTDKLVEQEAGMEISRIFAEYGEATFRQLEKEVIRKVTLLKNTVISTGGGVVLDPENFEILEKNSLFVYLRVSPEKLRLRCHSGKRPLLNTRTIEEIFHERKELYEKIPVSVNAENPPLRVAQEILYHLPPEEPTIVSGIEKIVISRGLLEQLHSRVQNASVFFVQRKVFDIFRWVFNGKRVFILPDGERAKSPETFKRAVRFLMAAKVDRGDTLVSVGGGAASDISGFVSSVFKRGIRFINVPTTLLSQVDAGIGGKNAINFDNVKNVVGTFYHPETVFIDPLTLLSLDTRAYRQGFAEIVKSAIIGDPDLFKYLSEHAEELKWRNMQALKDVILSTVRVKLRIVERDFRESSGERKILNLGHTFGHAFEVLLNLYHGEAVALGLLAAIEIGDKMGITVRWFYDRVFELLDYFDLLRDFERIRFLDRNQVLEKILQDKKIRDGKIDFVLPVEPGKVVIKSLDPHWVVKEVLR